MALRNYQNEYPSVTTILGVLRKLALEWWFKTNTLAFIEEKSKKGKEIGTQIHNVIQQFIEIGSAKIETSYPNEVTNALKSFMLFKKENSNIVLKKSEIALTSEQYKFNGTLDCVGETFIADWKTGEVKGKDKPTIYDEYLYQVSAYVNLWNEVNKTNIEKAIIVAVAKDKIAYNIYFMDKNEIEICFNEVFLPALKIYGGQKKILQLRKEKQNGTLPNGYEK